ncbi:MAG: hypothetical protein ACLVKR_06695 [Lachnospiraceae bacterium]
MYIDRDHAAALPDGFDYIDIIGCVVSDGKEVLGEVRHLNTGAADIYVVNGIKIHLCLSRLVILSRDVSQKLIIVDDRALRRCNR